MQDSADTVWNNDAARQFAEVVAGIANPDIMQKFLRDVMTEKEIIEISARLQAAKMLKDGKRYIDIIEQTKLSSRTVARINDWLRSGYGGYAAALETIDESHHPHTPPAHAA